MAEIKPIAVSRLSGYLKKIIDAEELLRGVRIYGEVCDFKISGGYAYFNFKDELATLSCVCFIPAAYATLKNGMQAILTGSPDFYVKGGRLSFKVTAAEEAGQGLAYLQFLEMKERLEKEGLFDPKHKKPIPKLVRKVGIVTSEKGAVIKDIISVATRRNPGIHLVLYPAVVQGAQAVPSLLEGIQVLDARKDIDVIIIARGGGSSEDLIQFNSEQLARCIYAAQKPVISAVGHETDFTICDFVADLRAPTPSAAAELVAVDRVGFKKQVKLYGGKIEAMLLRVFARKSQKFLDLNYTLKDAAAEIFTTRENALNIIAGKLEKLNPLTVLQQGYVKLSKNGAVAGFDDIITGDLLDAHLYGGLLKVEVKEKKSGI